MKDKLRNGNALGRNRKFRRFGKLIANNAADREHPVNFRTVRHGQISNNKRNDSASWGTKQRLRDPGVRLPDQCTTGDSKYWAGARGVREPEEVKQLTSAAHVKKEKNYH